MGYWSAENATEAYIKTMKMGKIPNEPETAEFISAIAAGNNAKLMVIACASAAGPTTLGLIAASHQTGGKLVCIVKGLEELHLSKQTLNKNAKRVEFVVGDAQHLLSHDYKSADLVVIDCNLQNHENILEAIQNDREKSTIVLGYNAFWKDSWLWSRSNSHLFPIGEGLLLMRVAGKRDNGGVKSGNLGGYSSPRRSHWVVKVDKCTGEEHVFRVRSPSGGSVVKA
ncbi:putative S-adenosyl-L-methionine-dependent methyltransferase [Tanacetum coccineum]|uniref:S-adenosyl-L-methionine-dependent methyltransferase n=1 Tax=Tanacetum coccineum TaxID=301880 RepID=A0ABQ5D478_9ASTR